MGDPVWQWSAVRTAAAIREGEISAEAVAEAHLERMRAANPAVNAVVVDMSEEALAAARATDRARARGRRLDALAGVPITIKENVDFEGRPNLNGVAANAPLVAPAHAPVVANLLGAGATCLGLTNTPEFSMRAHTDNPVHGETRNPWDASITCGGSSGGAGAATALGIGCIGHGNDIGGSLRWPAHCNGLATIRPTQGRVPAFNPSAPSERTMMAQMMSTQGPMAREVADVRLGLSVMARRDARDPFQVPAPLEGSEVPKRAILAKVPEEMEADPGVMGIVRAAADRLADAGWAVEERALPDVPGLFRLWADVLINEMDVSAGAGMLSVGSEDFAEVWGAYKAFSRELDLRGFVAACAERITRQRAWMALLEERPVILTPCSLQPTWAPGADLGGPETVRRLFAEHLTFISIFNLLGLPTAAVPAGLLDGRPVGVQLTATRFREDVALDAAEAVEDGVLCRALWAREDA